MDPAPRSPNAGPSLSRAEFAARYRAASRTLWVVAVSVVRDGALAEDVVQEAAVVALGKLEQFDPATSFEAWMCQMVRYVALNQARKRARQASPADPSGLPEAPAPAAPVSQASVGTFGQLLAGQVDFDDDVRRALDALDETPRACLLLRTVMDLSYVRIAELLAIPEGTAMSHVHRARRAMRIALASRRKGGPA
ncbi:MAG: RNA polymerase sigma factor [Phycisphaerales bacterium]|nr:RNA polymerase sigma factor [Phycisphaerales bacterium]